MVRGGGAPAPEFIAYNLKEAVSWWKEINYSPVWQDRIFHVLAALYGVFSAVALVQLVRIQLRVPEYGWTTQKVFHFLNFAVNGVRSLVFLFRRNVQMLHPEIMQHIMLDVPSLAFFTTYALLVLFWAEIYYQARAVSTDGLRPSFFTINAVIYTIQIGLWIISWWKPIRVVIILSKMFFACVSLFAALGFLLYGGRPEWSSLLGMIIKDRRVILNERQDVSIKFLKRSANRAALVLTRGALLYAGRRLFLMLQRFPVESKGRRKKLQEVGYVTTICFSCFLVRCIMMCFNAFDKSADLDVLDHPVLNFIYYLLVEIVPSALVLFILRKLPPKRGVTQYHPIR